MRTRFHRFINTALILEQYLFADMTLLSNFNVFAFGRGGGKIIFDENWEEGILSMGIYQGGLSS